MSGAEDVVVERLRRRAVEAAAIRAARSYAAENGRPEDRTVIGLMLAGMVISARCSDSSRRLLAAGYAEQHPDADAAMSAWATVIDKAEAL